MLVSTWPDISHLSISTPELVNALRQMGQQVKWPPKMKAHYSFRNPGLWCDFHRDHGHKTEDCIALRIEGSEVNDTGNWVSFRRTRTLNHSKNPRDPQSTYVDRSTWSPPKPFKVTYARKTWSSQDLRPPPHINKITENFMRYQSVVSRINKWARLLQGDLHRGYIGRIWSKGRVADTGWRHLARQETSETGRSSG
ncbi:hypothetical protein F2Q69_00006282 [Brassica cretica]|uniref:Uncharacterized protein n=1 Tax=Brassica cretica TaxID=69181 RepID=A0A8S9NUS1_BRACR|nr:hypothetical protein F2Q69_00006282 [Brassica cretica]